MVHGTTEMLLFLGGGLFFWGRGGREAETDHNNANSINKLQFFFGGGVSDGLECWRICQRKEKKRNLLMITTLQSFFFGNTDDNFEKKSINRRLQQ